MWGHQRWPEFPKPVAAPVADILDACLDRAYPFRSWDWKVAVKKLPAQYSARKIDLLARAITSDNLFEISDDAMSMLTSLAREQPDEVMKVVGSYALDHQKELFFLADDFKGLFEAIGSEPVQHWVKQAGPKAARAIARHLLGPMPTPDDPLHVPPLTEWLLSEFEDDDQVFQQFCSGRHSRQIYMGSISGCLEGTVERIRPYLDHPLRRVREWAQYEIDFVQGARSWEGRRDAEFGRD
jgi:hypothetical protein